ncbi:hypothetical protein IE53DRAFT_369445 [Violaceomyces palustris]|uniref:Uncharacterized protein n=1 Tax=Violaceomyces palustris TaxID=1673888 RepID=A0ACD0NVI2_9BASI|nr:hypothetical protein IE53DRAFT_369445 [Violaceomyces palustris]
MLSRSALAASVRNALRNRTLDSPKLHSKPVPRLVSRAFGQSSHKPNPRPLSSSAALGATAGALGLFLLSTLIPKGSSIQNEPALQLHQKAGATPALPLEKMLSMEEVEKHNALPEDGGQGIWVVIEGNVYE